MSILKFWKDIEMWMLDDEDVNKEIEEFNRLEAKKDHFVDEVELFSGNYKRRSTNDVLVIDRVKFFIKK